MEINERLNSIFKGFRTLDTGVIRFYLSAGAVSERAPSTTCWRLSRFSSVKMSDNVVSVFNVVSTVSVFVDGVVDVSVGAVVWPTVSSKVVIAGKN